MAKVKIVRTPQGSAPHEMLSAWVGVEIPLATEEDLRRAPVIIQFATVYDHSAGYVAFIREALEALRRAGKEEAATFWASKYTAGTYLLFQRNSCELVD